MGKGCDGCVTWHQLKTARHSTGHLRCVHTSTCHKMDVTVSNHNVNNLFIGRPTHEHSNTWHEKHFKGRVAPTIDKRATAIYEKHVTSAKIQININSTGHLTQHNLFTLSSDIEVLDKKVHDLDSFRLCTSQGKKRSSTGEAVRFEAVSTVTWLS